MLNPLLLSQGTILIITPVLSGGAFTVTPYSARGLSQTLQPITGSSANAAGSLIRRTINGELMDLTYPWFRKYASVITCKDVNTPCLDGAWLGMEVTVSCVAELNYPTGGTPQRGEVSGSSRVEGAFTYYRPQLNMMVMSIKNSAEEYSTDSAWSIELEEV